MLKHADFASEWRKSRFRGLEISKFSGGGYPRTPLQGVAFGAPFVRTPYAENLDPRQPLFGAIMTRNRLQLLLKFLHFNNSQKPAADDPNPDKLFKLPPLLDHLCEKFGEVYTTSRNIPIDKSLLLWQGCLAF